MKISIIISAYNTEKFLGRCLRSLISQNFKREDYEIIIIDDGSLDNTETVIKAFSNEVIHLSNSKNIGLPASLNKAIAIAQGEYIVRVDSDDYVNKNFLLFLWEFIFFNQAQYDSVACDYFEVNDKEETIARRSFKDHPIACGFMFAKKHYDAIGGYDPKMKIHEDKEFSYRYQEKFSIAYLPIPLYRYRKHDSNMTNDIEKSNYYEDILKERQEHGTV